MIKFISGVLFGFVSAIILAALIPTIIATTLWILAAVAAIGVAAGLIALGALIGRKGGKEA